MTLHTILLLMGIAAVVVAAGATSYKVSPWWIFAVAFVPTVVTLALALREIGESCGGARTSEVLDWVFGIATATSLTLYAAAAVGAVIDGLRQGKAGDLGAAASRCVACPVASACAVGIILYAFLYAVLHCLE